jgi:hypothetical protein
LAKWKEIVTRRSDVATLVRGEAAPGREKGGDDASCTDSNFIVIKSEKKITQSIQLLQMDGEDLKQ